MPRHKSAKRAAKRKIASVHQMEKEIFTAPAKLIAHLNKEMSALKKKENKIKNAFNKACAQVKKSEARMSAADKAKHTAAGKKKLKKVKKSHIEIIQVHAMQDKQLHEIMHAIENSKQNQSKLIALGKHLNQFERDWAKNAKQMKATTAAKSKSKKAHAKVKKVVPAVDQPKVESFETTMDHIRHEESSDAVS